MNYKEQQQALKKQHGGILEQTILVIAVLVVIGLIAFKTYNIAMEKIRVDQAESEVQTISQGIQELYTNTNDYSTIDTATVISAGIVSDSDVVSNQIATPWYKNNSSSIITIAPSSNPTSFSINLAAIPSDACSKVGSSFLNQGTAVVTGNGTVATSPTDLAKNCATANPATLSVSF